MSGITLQDVGLPAVLASGPDFLLQLADDSMATFRVVDGGDMLEANCALLVDTSIELGSLHPAKSWDITYPYARTAIRVRMDDPRPLDQIAQLVAVAPYLSIFLVLVDYVDRPVAVASCTATVEPPQLVPCATATYKTFGQPYLLLQIDSATIGLPARISLDITDVQGRRRVGWIGLRVSRDGLPSGAVL